VSEASPPPPRAIQPASPQAVQQAIEEVNRIIETLRGTLEDMDLVLETLELAERQKNADEQEIDTLRRGLRHLHRPRDGGEHSHHH
jgi:predicted RNase H-like nuclease (RuvC/YqgF family)